MNCTLIARLSALCTTIVLTALLALGPIDPPAGPVGSTNKTLAEIEPRIAINSTNTPGDANSRFRITSPGSYYLTGSIFGQAGKHGILVESDNVTIDLRGFTLQGSSSGAAVDGVSVQAIGTNVAVINGSVKNWRGSGINLGAGVKNCRVEDILASGNVGYGIRTSDGCVVSKCVATSNFAGGISTGQGCVVRDCAADFNITSSGILLGTGSTVTGSSARGNQANGIATVDACTIAACTTFENSSSGVSTGYGCTVTDCTASTNTVDGIVCFSNCAIRNNTCTGNGLASTGAGIHIWGQGTDTRVEGNNCTGNRTGVRIEFAGNIIVRNTCSGNSFANWDVVAGNFILVVNATAAGAVIGNAGGTALGSTDPNANFSY